LAAALVIPAKEAFFNADAEPGSSLAMLACPG
jgi:hypothetical protein